LVRFGVARAVRAIGRQRRTNFTTGSPGRFGYPRPSSAATATARTMAAISSGESTQWGADVGCVMRLCW
jgi:hypothetical protein